MKKDTAKKLATNIVNQLFDIAEVSVEKRQAINDKCDEFVVKLIQTQIHKAAQWDELGEKIDRCYTNEDGSENTDPDIDLCTIGEIACVAFGYL